ncbi:unnamed protein product [Amaranthus hypochondriacus]
MAGKDVHDATVLESAMENVSGENVSINDDEVRMSKSAHALGCDKNGGSTPHLLGESSFADDEVSKSKSAHALGCGKTCVVGPKEILNALGENVMGSSDFVFNVGVGVSDARKHIKAKQRVDINIIFMILFSTFLALLNCLTHLVSRLPKENMQTVISKWLTVKGI